MKKILYVFVIFITIFLIGIKVIKTFVYPIKYFDIIKQEAINNNIDPYLILSIIKAESSFHVDATSNKNAKGLMQMIDSTAQEVNNKINNSDNIEESNNYIDIYDASTNIALGCNYFASLVERYEGNYYLAICAYNAGLGNVDKWISDGIVSPKLDSYENINLPFKETEKYLKKVMTTYKIYKILYK
ncbi:MAG: lytic transglycosylase domain-containing protein [Clostridia bacterium]|nr:lytic transglycosylase domain-containing protein [Clostridia bacterium]